MIYRFRAYELDIDRHELRYAGAPSPIEPQVFEVLAYLIAQRHRVVTKQELLDHLWPTHFVSDNTLHQRLTAARRAIGDNSRTQSCIKTLRGLGYRFIATVEECAEALRDTDGLAVHNTSAASDGTEVSLASLAPPEVERRQLTIMCCALADTAALADQLAPEDLRDIVQAYHHTCSTVIQRYAGYIAPSLGDRLLVYFGYPHAHEDDAQQAIQAGLSLLDAVETLSTRLQRETGVHIAMRVGIHTGLMVIGEMGGSGGQESLALGEAPHIADRLQGIAAPNTAVVSEATYRVVEGYFTCEAFGEHALSGVAAPIAVYRVLRRSSAQSRLDIAGTRGLTPLVGRQQEVGLLLERWEQVHEGRGQVVVLSGEAGIGKSRLVQVRPSTWNAREPHASRCAVRPLTQTVPCIR